MPVEIGSTGEWDRALSSNAVVVADFHATWCGPCKMIAPTFESLSTKYAKPGKIAFCKIDVDAQRDIASRYSVRSMPTFIIFRSGSEHKRIAGADPGKLTNEVSEAVKLAGAAAAPSFSTPGRALGVSSGQKLGSGGRRGGGGWSIPSPTRFLNALITFFGLYFASLITFDPYKAAENSQFNVNRRDAPQPPIRGSGQKVGSAAPPRPSGGVRTLKDLGGS